MNSQLLSLMSVTLIVSCIVLWSNSAMSSSPQNSSLKESATSEKLKMWRIWKEQMGRVYASEEQEAYRFENFKQNLQKISDHNSNESQSFTMGLTQFSDLSSDEFMAMYLSPLPTSQNNSTSIHENYRKNKLSASKKQINLGQSYNWCTSGACPPIGDMGQCNGGSYAWAAVEGLESLYYIKKNVNVSLSVEQVIQCSQSYGNNGCSGGKVFDAYLYNEHNQLTTTTNYPYTSGNGQTGSCNQQAASTGSYAVQNVNIIPPVCEYIANDLDTNPIAICLAASSQFQQYSGGIFPSNQCSSDSQINLCMLLVGVQYESFWYLQNAWGTSWGQGGMMQLQYGNSCGICGNAWQPQFNNL